MSLLGDDQEERKNDAQLKTTLMLLEMIDKGEDFLFSLSLSSTSIEVERLIYLYVMQN